MRDFPFYKVMSRVRDRLLILPRRRKRLLLVFIDFTLLLGVLWLGVAVRYGTSSVPSDLAFILLILVAPFLTVATMAYAGLYRLVTRYLGENGHRRIIFSVGLSVLVWSLLILLSGQNGIPRTMIILYGFVGAAILILSRQAIAWLLRSRILRKTSPNATPQAVLIYGAGHWGVQLSHAVALLPNFEIVGFCDRSPSLWGQYVNDFKVYRPDRLASVIDRFEVKQVLLANPTADPHEHRQVLKELELLPVEVKVMPSLEDIAGGSVRLTDLRPIEVLDLLGRDIIPPLPNLLSRNSSGRSVLITGAGGSVGAELARQVARLHPRRLILLDVSEVALYQIDIELRDAKKRAPAVVTTEIVTVLGSVLDRQLLNETLRRYDVDIIYHAAAYKHVPLIQHNAEIGITNNTFGTAAIATAAVECDVGTVVLISTDKAVRPTNIMGASKRLAELVLKTAATKTAATKFTMVRFGNVLDSSGSVVRRFREQISAGGPVTVTDPRVTRYFMSLTEAAELVIQAAAMAENGQTFVLDMGQPVKVDDLARLMIRLSGRDVRSADNPEGDIEIDYIGLRPGEKLYEELLISGNFAETEHTRIKRLIEPPIDAPTLERELEHLRLAVNARDTATIEAILLRTVEGYNSGTDIQSAEAAATIWGSDTASRTLH